MFTLKAEQSVDAVLSRPLWKESGHITGSSLVVPGLGADLGMLRGVLLDAGYSWVEDIQGDREFLVDQRSMLVRQGERDILITFDASGVSSVSPDGLLAVEGIELAGNDFGGGVVREPVVAENLPKHVVDSILAMEDSRFFEHPGIDALGIIRALLSNVLSEGSMQGGSTLTQQLAKNLFLTPERTLERKFKELFLALALEDRLSKGEILELYLNQVYLGQVAGIGIGGIDQAARVYFGVQAERLDLGQAATLAGLISAPNRYSPARHPEEATKRRDLALRRMVDLDLVSSEKAKAAMSQALRVSQPRGSKRAPWAVDFALEQVVEKWGEESISGGPLRIHTAIDPILQHVAEQSVQAGMEALGEAGKGAQVALVAMNASNGDVLAMVGGRDYRTSSFNRGVHGRRQLGSTVKAFSWLFAYDADPGLAPSTVLPDEPISIQTGEEVWEPQNYDGQFLGEVTMRQAMMQSRNIPAIHVAQATGFEGFSRRLKTVGLNRAGPYPSTSLGAFDVSPLELCAAYTVFPGQGKFVNPRIIRSVRLPDGTEGWSKGVDKWRAASARSAFLAATDLQGVVSEGTGRRIHRYVDTGAVVGGKTGTTDNARDAWFVGYSGDLVVSVWVGFDKGRPLGLTGAQAAAPIWGRFVATSGRLSGDPLSIPDGVEAVSVCQESHQRAEEACTQVYDSWVSKGGGESISCALHADPQQNSTHSIIERLRRSLQKQPDPVEDKDEKRKGWFRRKSR